MTAAVKPAHLVREGKFEPEAVSKPPSYRGVALFVVRDPDGAPVSLHDGNGKVVWTRHGFTYEMVDVPWRGGVYSPAAVTQAVNGDGVDGGRC